MKGIVLKLEKNKGKMVVVTDEGDFLHAPIPKKIPLPGETVDVSIVASPKAAKRSTRPYWLAAAVVLFLILSMGVLQPRFIPQAVAAVSMDLVSSVEISVNHDNKVVEAAANNPEGQAVLSRLQLKGKDVYEAANMVTLTAAELGYLTEGRSSNIIVTLSPLKDKTELPISRERLQQSMHDQLSARNYQGYLVVSQVNEDIRKQASRMGVTVNKYLLLKKFQDQLNPEEAGTFNEATVGQLMKTNEGQIEKAFPGMWCRVGTKKTEYQLPSLKTDIQYQQPNVEEESNCKPKVPVRRRGCSW